MPGLSFIDSTHLKVCHNEGYISIKSLKNRPKEDNVPLAVLWFQITPDYQWSGWNIVFLSHQSNVDDRDWKHFQIWLKPFSAKSSAIKAMFQSTCRSALGNGIQMVAKPKKNMKNVNLSQEDKIMLRKRAIIECVNDELKNICKLQHTRHRSVANFLLNILALWLLMLSSLKNLPSISFWKQRQSITFSCLTELTLNIIDLPVRP